MQIYGLLYKRAAMVIMMVFSGCINQQNSKWEGTGCRLGKRERMGASCRSSKEVLTVGQGWGQESAELRSCPCTLKNSGVVYVLFSA